MSRALRLKNQRADKRATRVRRRLRADNSGRPRLSVHRTENHISVQVIDDAKGVTIAAASTMEKDLRKTNPKNKGGTIAAATAVGELIGERAKKAGVTEVTFDKGSFNYHGRVKALADAARKHVKF